MKKEYKAYEVFITPITDIHIGTGRTILPYEYTVKDKYFYLLNATDLYKKLTADQKRKYSEYAEKNIIDLRRYVKDIYSENLGFEFKFKVSPNLKRNYDSKIGGAITSNDESQLQVQEMTMNENGVYIPGSTIKGAIRGAYIERLAIKKQEEIDAKNKTNNKDKYIPLLDYEVKRDTNKVRTPYVGNYKGDNKTAQKLDKKFQEIAFDGEFNPFSDPFKNIKITDTSSTGDVSIKEIRIYSFSKKRETFVSGPPVYSMVLNGELDSKTKLKGKLKIEKNYKEKSIKDIDLKDILTSLNRKFETMIEEDMEFYEDMRAKSRHNRDLLDKILDKVYEIDDIYSELNPDNQAIIRFGKGAGFNSTTFNLSAKGSTYIASRNISEDILPMGWALIEFKEII